MSLDEIIQHARDIAEAHGCPAGTGDCAYQHDKLVNYLEELKAYRATGLTPDEITRRLSL